MKDQKHGRRPRLGRGRKGMVSCTTAIATALLALASSTASATGYPIGTPTPVDPGFSCLNFDTAGLLREMTITPVDGARGYNDGTLDLTVVYYQSTAGWILDWYQENTGPTIRHAIVQDGDATSHAYTYNPPVTSDRQLHGDEAPSRVGKPMQYKPLVRATFCYATEAPPNYGGCSPGEWRGNEFWPVGINFDDSLITYFGNGAWEDSLINALDYPDDDPGLQGAKAALLKQAVAALLNAGTDWVNYPLSVDQVTQFTRFALESNDIEAVRPLTSTLSAYNSLGCVS
ncbi:MAG: hypothetical protein E6Q88_04640 [Lysobacteraceae bacterium]|nr:MAG: hypothetical protein E6Q88_04640 [Xanthomonadaceae bacterium]